MFRFTFYQIPFMRNGTRVPALAAGVTAVSALEKYKKTEIVTRLQFSETQAQAVINNGDAIADSGANYMRVARTTSETVGDYSTDTAAAFYWVDDIQLLAAAEGRTPAALVSFTPDPWLTDFFAPEASPTVRGRLAQTTKKDGTTNNEPKESAIDPVTSYTDNPFAEIRPFLDLEGQSDPPQGVGYRICGIFSAENSQIVTFFTSDVFDRAGVSRAVWEMGCVNRVSMDFGAGVVQQDVNLSVSRLYVIPAVWVDSPPSAEEYIDLQTGWSTVSAYKAKNGAIGSIYGYNAEIFTVDETTTFGGGKEWLKPSTRAYVCTPKRQIELREPLGVTRTDGLGALFWIRCECAANFHGAASLSILMFINGEWIDVSSDFEADFAVNEEAVKQSQNKSLYALQSITNVIGAVGGAIGGVKSGNYFGAVQAVAGGINGLAEQRAARRQPAAITNAGGTVCDFIERVGLLYIAIIRAQNETQLAEYAEEYGYILTNEPLVQYGGADLVGEFARFAEVDVTGTTGGQLSQLEIADAFRRGVRLVEL